MTLPYNVLYVTESYSPHDRRFLKVIGQQARHVWFAHLNPAPSLSEALLPPPVSLWPGLGRSPSEWKEMIREREVHVIHAGPLNSVLPHVTGYEECAVVGMSWGSDILALDSQETRQKGLLKESLSKINGLIVDCKAVLNKVKDLVPEIHIPFIEFPWGVEWERFRELPEGRSLALRDQLGWKDKAVLISTRSWSDGYGILTLLESFQAVLCKRPDLKLILVGDGPLRESVHSRIREMEIGDKIYCAGRVDEGDLPVYYGAADLYVSPSLTDGSSVSLLEAMACGLPVIVHRDHGNLEWVSENENGWLVDCHHPHEIGDAILKAVIEKPLARIVEANRAKVRRRADWEVNSKNISRAYTLAHDNFLEKRSAARV